MNIQPLQNYVLLKDIPKTETKGGILLGDNLNLEETIPGEVLKVGEKVTYPIGIGAKVLFKRHMCEDLMIGNEQFLIGPQDCIFAKLDD